MSLHEKWENIDHRLRMLDAADQDERLACSAKHMSA